MELQTRLRLSFYREIADINTAHHIRLVQHTVSGKIFVKKELSIYDLQVFQYLMTETSRAPQKLKSLSKKATPYTSSKNIFPVILWRKSLPKKVAFQKKKLLIIFCASAGFCSPCTSSIHPWFIVI